MHGPASQFGQSVMPSEMVVFGRMIRDALPPAGA